MITFLKLVINNKNIFLIPSSSEKNLFIYLGGDKDTVFVVVESRLIFCSSKFVQVDCFTSYNRIMIEYWRINGVEHCGC